MIKRLEELCDLVVETVDPRDALGKPYVGMEHVRPGALTLRASGSPGSVTSAKATFNTGDVLYGKLRPYLDKAVLASFDGVCSTELLVLRPKPQVPGAFLAAFLHTVAFRDHAVRNTHGVNHPRTSWNALASFGADLPEPENWHRIASALTAIQDGLDAVDRLIAATRELKQAAMRQLFTRGLRGEERKDTEIGLIPASWSVGPLEESREFLQYGTSVKCDYGSRGRPVLRIPNVVNGFVDDRDLKRAEVGAAEEQSLTLQVGDVLFVRTNGVRERVGSTAVYEGRPEGALFASYLIRARLRQDRLMPEFLQAFTETKAGRAQLSGQASPAADGKFNINTKAIDSLLVPRPEISEQGYIMDIVRAIDAKRSAHERRRAALNELFERLLQDLMTGGLRVGDAEAVPV